MRPGAVECAPTGHGVGVRRFWTTAELLARGRSEREIRRAGEDGRIEPVRRGLWAVPGTPSMLLRAARVGGVATSVTAAGHLGIWTPPDPPPGHRYRYPHVPEQDRLHVAFRRTTSRLHDPDEPGRRLGARSDVVLHPTAPDVIDAAAGFGVAPALLTVEHAFRSLPPEHALAVLDSALHHRHLQVRDLAALAAALPSRLRALPGAADARADSGIESIARHLLLLAGLAVVVHPVLPGIGEVDLLVEGRLVVELDGRQHHDDEEAFVRDRARDLAAARTRYRTLRFTWRQVLFEWASVEAAVFAALAA